MNLPLFLFKYRGNLFNEFGSLLPHVKLLSGFQRKWSHAFEGYGTGVGKNCLVWKLKTRSTTPRATAIFWPL